MLCDSCNEVWKIMLWMTDWSWRISNYQYRELYMKTGQGFLLVFSITSNSSLHELSELREQIIRIKDDENVPIVIVGNKSDLEEHRMVSRSKAFQVSQSWGNAPYYETSARRRGRLVCCPASWRERNIYRGNMKVLTRKLNSERRRGLHRPLPADYPKR